MTGSLSAALGAMDQLAKRQEYRPLIAGYIPRTDLTAIAIALYGVICILLWSHFFRHGRHKWMLTLTIGTTCMLIGFFTRIGCHYDPYSLGIYIISTLFILLSPCAFLAADYVCLSRLALYLGQDVTKNCLVFPVTALVKFFVIMDVTTFLIQAAGGGITASTQNNPSLGSSGQIVSTIGLSLQLASFLAYTIVLILFGIKVRKMYPEKWNVTREHPQIERTRWVWWKAFATHPVVDWRILYFGLLLTCIAFITRSSFRVAEFQGGYSGYLYVTEGYFWALDALPLFLGLLVFVFIWPPRFLKYPELFTSSVHGEEEMLPTGAATVPAVTKDEQQNVTEADAIKL